MAELDRYQRVRLLVGEDAFTRLSHAKVLLLGVGGVGGFCLDALIRSGVRNITIVDEDTFELTNQNRQIGSEGIGEVKVTRLHTLYPSVCPLHVKVDAAWAKNHDFSAYDIVIDAIDDMRAKVALALHVNVPLLSSMGSAKRLDPTAIVTDSVWNTQGDALAKKFRYELRKAGFDGDFPVVYSKEAPLCKELGSFVGVTGSFGLTLASLAIRTLLAAPK
jgi:tRNA A37 threonylcarbamoyladenosine dehydratase